MFTVRRATPTSGSLAAKLAQAPVEAGAPTNTSAGVPRVAQGAQVLRSRLRDALPRGQFKAYDTPRSVALGISQLHRSYHSSSSHLLQAVNRCVSMIDQAFSTRDMRKFDAAYAGLQAIQNDVKDEQQARMAHRDAMSALFALSQDSDHLLAAVLNYRVDTMEKLADFFGLDDSLKTIPEALEGRCNLDPGECLALSLYSVREKYMSIGPEVFRAVNALDRASLPSAVETLKFLTQPLQSGMEKLPSVNGAQLRRGMKIGNQGDIDTLKDAKIQFAAGKLLHSGTPTTGSLTAAYPGNVVLLVQSSAKASRLKDTSAFNYGGADQPEATFLPGTRFQVIRADEKIVPNRWVYADLNVASSGRTWSDYVGKPVLVVQATEVVGETDLRP